MSSSIDLWQVIDEELAGTVTAVLFVIVMIFGLIGNFLAVTVVSCNASMRSTTNNLIVSLSSADLLFIVFCIPFTGAQFVLRHWPFGDLWCKTVQYIICVTAFASVYTLVMLSFHRYLAVVHPTTFMFFRTERSWTYAILTMWLIIIVYNLKTFGDFGEVPIPVENPGNGSILNFQSTLNGSSVNYDDHFMDLYDESVNNSSMKYGSFGNVSSSPDSNQTVCICLHEGRDLQFYQSWSEAPWNMGIVWSRRPHFIVEGT
ncbi:hypothetical protein GE061_006985 [Apolygus lucorum]|uniref:G-protein coupled receptors family 1 profile domain-containing protein n=1 Tax=Apolygus lucorum TaxID=248454 RepID=A0A8S9WQE2_APOLU|nr:hypothetical protein GE061_006985 [Apolygus lucorum]